MKQNLLKRIFENQSSFVPFVAAAALIHSTWTVSVMFNGMEPPITDLGSFLHWLWWVLPGALFALALDVGQIVGASAIRSGSKTRIGTAAKVFTFAIMAFFSYALQLVYLLHHIPSLAFGSGVSETSKLWAGVFMEVMIWLVPFMLPISIVLFTGSDAIEHPGHKQKQPEQANPGQQLNLQINNSINGVIAPIRPLTVEHPPEFRIDDTALQGSVEKLDQPSYVAAIPPVTQDPPEQALHTAICNVCGKVLGTDYATARDAQLAVNGHKISHRSRVKKDESIKVSDDISAAREWQ